MKTAHPLARRVRLVSLATLLICFTGCSSFNRDWKRAQSSPPPTDDITGAWEGSWISERNGHKGKLRALLVKQREGDYRARFHATFLKIFSYSYATPLRAFPDQQRYTFEGSADLGWLAGGEYKCHGTATATDFHAVYSSKHDHGKFEMKRPVPPSPK